MQKISSAVGLAVTCVLAKLMCGLPSLAMVVVQVGRVPIKHVLEQGLSLRPVACSNHLVGIWVPAGQKICKSTGPDAKTARLHQVPELPGITGANSASAHDDPTPILHIIKRMWRGRENRFGNLQQRCSFPSAIV